MSEDRVAALLEDIEKGPTALAELLDAYAAPGGPLAGVGGRPARLLLTGLGSSRYAALAAAAQARRADLPAWAEFASTGSPTPPDEDLVLVAISASGRTREVVAAARRHLDISRVVAVTNDPGSPLAGEADHVLPLLAGQESAGIATRTFRATVAVLGMLIGRWGGAVESAASLRPTVEALRAVMDGSGAWLPAAADRLDGAAAIDVIGDAADAALVHQAALMLREAPRLPAVSHETGDWLHTGVYLGLPGHRALLFAGSEADDEVVGTIDRRGGETIVVGDEVPGAAQSMALPLPAGSGPFERAIVGSVVTELLAAELWRRTSAEERPPT
jgi:glucosamine--fructose-6-phosphate aminotransferase (isomerizing)